MACCGGRKRTVQTTGSRTADMQLDLQLVRYSGVNRIELYGIASGTRYVFDGNRSLGYVDVRDVKEMLDMGLFEIV